MIVVKSITNSKNRESISETYSWANGEIRPVIAYETCLNALRSSPYHQSAVNSKAEFSVGMGYEIYDNNGNLSTDLMEEWDRLWDNSFQTEIDKISLDFETFGNAFIELVCEGNGLYTATGLYHVPAKTIRAISIDNQIHYQQTSNNRVISTMPKSDGTSAGLLHIRQYSPSARLFGEPDWVAALKPINLDANATEYNNNFFKNNCMPQWAIVMENNTVDSQTEEAIRDFFQTELNGVDNAHKTLLLSGGGKVEFVKLQLESTEMSFLQLKNTCRDEIAAAHNIPPRLMGIATPGSLGGSGEMQWQLRFFENGKLKKRRVMYQNIFNKILNNNGVFKFLGLDLSLDQDDANYYKTLVESGIMDNESARRELGYT